jgi:hypothetical protein
MTLESDDANGKRTAGYVVLFLLTHKLRCLHITGAHTVGPTYHLILSTNSLALQSLETLILESSIAGLIMQRLKLFLERLSLPKLKAVEMRRYGLVGNMPEFHH